MIPEEEGSTCCRCPEVLMRIHRGEGSGRRESEGGVTTEGPGDTTLCLESGERNRVQEVQMAFQRRRRQGIQSFSIKKSEPAGTPL